MKSEDTRLTGLAGVSGKVQRAVGAWREITKHRRVRLSLQALLFSVCGIYLFISLQSVSGTLASLHINYVWLAAAWGLTLLAVLLGAMAWWLILLSLGQNVSWSQSAYTHLFSNLAKYLPGYAWQLMGKAYLTQRLGVSARLVGLGMTIEFAQLILVGLGVAVGLVPDGWLMQWLDPGLSSHLHLVKAIALVGVVMAIFSVSPFFSVLWRQSEASWNTAHFLLAALLSILASWLIFGFSFWLLGSALSPLPWGDVPLFMFALTVSVIIGLVVIFAPGGIGVRESLLVFILGPTISPPMAVLVATLTRVIVALSELSGAALLAGWLRWHKATEKDDNSVT